MDNASNVIDVASVPFQEHLASASMTLPANNAGSLNVASSKKLVTKNWNSSINHYFSSCPIQRPQLVPNDAFITPYRRGDQSVPVFLSFYSDVCSTFRYRHMQSVEAICAAFTPCITGSSQDPSQSFLNLTSEYLPDLHRIYVRTTKPSFPFPVPSLINILLSSQ